jgi:hypothetical protein
MKWSGELRRDLSLYSFHRRNGGTCRRCPIFLFFFWLLAFIWVCIAGVRQSYHILYVRVCIIGTLNGVSPIYFSRIKIDKYYMRKTENLTSNNKIRLNCPVSFTFRIDGATILFFSPFWLSAQNNVNVCTQYKEKEEVDVTGTVHAHLGI